MDEEVKKEFEKIWKKINELENNSKEGNLPKNTQVNLDDSQFKDNDLGQEIHVFCRNNGIDGNRLKNFIDFRGNLPKLREIKSERVRTNLQLNILLTLAPIILRIYKKNFSEKIIRDLFILNGIPLERMDKLYSSKKFNNFFGKFKTEVKLKWAGEQEGIKKIKGMIENETNTSK